MPNGRASLSQAQFLFLQGLVFGVAALALWIWYDATQFLLLLPFLFIFPLPAVALLLIGGGMMVIDKIAPPAGRA